MPIYGQAQIESLRQTGNLRMVSKLEKQQEVSGTDWMRTFFRNLWRPHFELTSSGIGALATGAVAIATGGLAVPIVGWSISGSIAAGVLLLGVGLLLVSLNSARKLTNEQLTPSGEVKPKRAGATSIYTSLPDFSDEEQGASQNGVYSGQGHPKNPPPVPARSEVDQQPSDRSGSNPDFYQANQSNDSGRQSSTATSTHSKAPDLLSHRGDQPDMFIA